MAANIHAATTLMEHPIANYWHAAAVSEFASPSDWKAWADRVILASHNLDDWIIYVSLAGTLEDLLSTIWDQKHDEVFKFHCRFVGDTSEAILGYLTLRWERGDLEWRELLLNFLDMLEHGALLGLVRTEAFSEACELMDSCADLLDSAPFPQLKQALEPYRNLADDQWQYLQEYPRLLAEENG